jgi:hypothetical protein
MRPTQAVNPKFLEVSFGNWFLSCNIWSKESSEQIEKLSNSDNFWKWHDIVIISVKNKL